MKLIPKMSKDTKQTLIAGIAGGIIFHMEEAANGLVVGYPQVLKDRVIPQLPRNGQLVADLAPLGVGWGLAKKRPSDKNDNIKMGLTLYDLPKLMHQVIWNVAYQAGLPATGAGLMRQQVPLNLNIAPVRFTRPNLVANGIASAPVGMGARMGKYAMKVNTPKTMTSGGIGKYR